MRFLGGGFVWKIVLFISQTIYTMINDKRPYLAYFKTQEWNRIICIIYIQIEQCACHSPTLRLH
mgnify:CR=1 FL=1